MRYIDTSQISVPSNWVALAKADLGKNYPSLWSYFKADFERISGKKCWYSESDNTGSVNPIDHFRPQANTLASIPQYEETKSFLPQINNNKDNGYPFLELEFCNYRYACDVVNSSSKKNTPDNIVRGKSNYFPIRNDSIRAKSISELPEEISCLLDPCIQNDTELIVFNELGKIQAHPNVVENSWEFCRVKISIEVYHLHYNRFIEKRLEKWNFCKERIELINQYFEKAIRGETDDLHERNFLSNKEMLENAINIKSEFSAVAIDCIRYYQKGYHWLPRLFATLSLMK